MTSTDRRAEPCAHQWVLGDDACVHCGQSWRELYEVACANPRCLNGANCPGHPWRKDELGELAKLELHSRDMNEAAYRGAGFRQAREFFQATVAGREAPRESER